MSRALAVLLVFLAIALLEFEFYPGHTYLGSSSQIYLPILEHLQSPSYLTRDLVATHPNVTYTVYDEATLFLHAAAKTDFRKVLAAQQIVCRLALLLGIFMLARTAGLKPFVALGAAALINLGTFLPGPAVWLIDPEPVPRAFAIGLAFLALGCLVQLKPLLSALFGGLALLYDPLISAPFWLLVLLAFLFDRHMRKLIKPMLPVLLVFALLLANLAQLQPGTPDAQPILDRFSRHIAAIERFRSPEHWVSLWPRDCVYLYLALFVTNIWAVTRVWPALNRQLKWILLYLPLATLLSIPLSALLLDRLHYSIILRLQPTSMLVYLVALSWFAALLAAFQAYRHHAKVEFVAWMVLALAILLPGAGKLPTQRHDPAIEQLATWAENETWGSSMFLFPQAGRQLYPGVFRAQSRRSLWVDWESGRQITYHVQLASDWWSRWRETMRGPLSADHLQKMLSLPIDYYVFQSNCFIASESEGRTLPVKPVFLNSEFAVYDASILRIAPGNLTLSINGRLLTTRYVN
jgi:hypothetical protein